jgi:predicted aspartyl protease
MLDTAAGRSIITPETFAKLKLKPINKRSLRVEGAGGGLSASLVDVGSFGVGRYRRRQMSAVVLDLKQIEEQIGEPLAGILGMDFLKDYDVRVDLGAKKLRLYACDEANDVDALVSQDVLERVQFKAQHGGLIMVKIYLDGAPVTGLLDTGAGRTIMNWKAAEAAGVTRETKGVKKQSSRYFGVDNNRIDLFRYEFKQLEIGASRYSPAKIGIADLPVFATLGFKEMPAIIIGADFLKDRVLFIAQSTGHVYLSRDEEQGRELAANVHVK